MARFTQIGAPGSNGAAGLGIAKIEKTKTEGLVDTYTITYTNGTITTFTVTNGTGVTSIESEEHYENGEYTVTPITFNKNDGTTNVVNVIAKNGVGGSGTGSTNNAILTATNTSGWRSKTIATGTDCSVSFVWDSKEEGEATGNGIVKITVNGVVRTSYEVEQGEVPVDLTNYLTLGTNTIQIEISDVYLNSRVMGFTVNCVSISISSSFDATRAYTGSIDFRYVPVGDITKTMHFKMDGTEIPESSVTIGANGREQGYTIPAQSHGSHTFEVYFSCEINGSYTESNHLFYDLICYEEGNTDPIVATPFRNTTVEQYSTVAIPYSVYTPGFESSNVTLKVNGKEVSNITVDRKQQTWSYKVRDYEDVTLSIVSGSATKTINLTVAESSMNVAATTENLVLYLTSNGRSNNEENPDTWTYGSTEAVFNDKFNWESDGWKLDENNNTVLRVAGDARVYIPFFIFEQDCRTNGKTIEIEFATRDVLNYDATIISSWSGDRGIKITAQKATIKSEQKEISTQYKEDETVRVTFAVNKSSDHRLLTIYINGIMSGVVQYTSSDDFSQVPPAGISIGSNDCTTDIYCIRVYDSELTSYQILDNWIADTQDLTTMYDRYKRNNIFDSYDNISISKLPKYLPYMILNVSDYSSLPQHKRKEDEDKIIISGSYVDNLHPERSFTFTEAEIDVQGTSSQYYPRKNYKIKFKNGFVINGDTVEKYCLRSTSIPTNEFTFKADVASSEGANNVELVRLYDDTCPAKTPPQETDPRVRQGIEGYPIVMFYGTGDNYTFLGKYNFNNDKATGEVFGMEDGDESWEILQNNTQMAVWKDANFSDDNWKITFKARYPDDNVETSNLQLFATWLVSTDTTQATNEVLPNRISYEWTVTKSTRVPGTYDIVNASCTYNTDSEEYRIAKFRTEFSRYANVDAMLFNYIFTETFLMVDNRAKNAFPTRYDEDGKWVILPYDYDSAIGIDNEGALVFGYELEDTDLVNNGETQVFNGRESVLYNNMRLAFADEISKMYRNLRTKDVFSYEEIEKRFEDHQEVWSEAIFNEDARFKYIDPLVNDNNGEYLKMLQGSKAEQRKWWLYNRFRYLDSKYNAGDSLEDYILLRTYGKADIEVTPYADIYASAKFDEILVQKRALRGNTYTLENPLDDGNHGVLSIFSASQLSSIGDLSGLKLSMCDFTMATKLSELKIGSNAEGYTNPNLTEVYVGNLTLLKNIDVRNCTSLTQSVDLSGCTNIEEVYFDGTAVTGVQLPNGGSLKKLHLPGTIVSLELMNQPQLTEFVLPSYSNISTLRIENMSKSIIDTLAVVRNLKASSRVRLIGVDWTFNSATEALGVMNILDTLRGLDEQGNNVDKAVVTGKIHVPSLTREQLNEMNSRYPNITVEYDVMTVKVSFYNGTTVFNAQYLTIGEKISIPPDPTKASTAQYHFNFAGWSLDGVNVIDITDAVAGDTNTSYYAVYDEELRYYNVRFLNDDGSLLQFVSAAYGSIPVYTGETPAHTTEAEAEFIGWTPSIGEVIGNTIYTAKYLIAERLEYKFIEDGSYYAVRGKGTVTSDVIIPDTFKGYPVKEVQYFDLSQDETIRSLYVGSNVEIFNCDFSKCTSLESVIFSENSTLTFIDSEFSYCSSLKSVVLPKLLSQINRNMFGSCTSLESINIPDSVSVIDDYAFYGCTSLKNVNISDNSNLTSIRSRAFMNCSKLESIYIPPSLKTYNISSEAFYYCTSLKEVYFDDLASFYSNSVHSDSGLFSSAGAKAYLNGKLFSELVIPQGTTSLSVSHIFAGCTSITSVTIPDTVTSLGTNYFTGSYFGTLPYLETIYMMPTVPVSISNREIFMNNQYLKVVYVPSGSIDAYLSDSGWSRYSAYIAPMPPTLTYTLNDNGTSYIATGISDTSVTNIVIPNTYGGLPVTSINTAAFRDMTSLTSVTISNSVDKINWNAFQGCTNLTSVNMSNSVTFIGGAVFYGCSSLTSITLPDTLTSIGSEALAKCGSLATIAIHAVKPPTCPSNLTDNTNTLIFVPDESVEAYKKASGWSTYASRIYPIPELAYTLNSDNASYSVSGIGSVTDTEVVIPESYKGKPVTALSSGAFENNKTITSVTIQAQITNIPSNAFKSCTALRTVTYPDSVTSIGSEAFAHTDIETISLPSVETIGAKAFNLCMEITVVDIGENIRSIGGYAFSTLTGPALTKDRNIIIRSIVPPSFGSDWATVSTRLNIYVPDESLSAYKTATNFGSRIQPLSSYNN